MDGKGTRGKPKGDQKSDVTPRPVDQPVLLGRKHEPKHAKPRGSK